MRFLADYFPLLLFFVAFKLQGVWVATAVAIAASIVQIAWFHWRGSARCNDFSIGVELEGSDATPYTAAQYRRLGALLRMLAAHYGIRDVAGHSDIAPGRKTDPGPCFDWRRVPPLDGPA